MRRSLPVFALILCSCSQRAKVAAVPPALGKAAMVKAVPVPAFEHQIRGAVDAGDGDFLVKSLRARVIAHPDELAPRLSLAKAYRERGYPELAIEHYRMAAQRFPDSAETQLLLAKDLRQAGLPAEAADSLEAFARTHPGKSPNSLSCLSWLGILRDEAGQWSQGEASHRAALELAPNRDDLHNNLGYCLLMQGKNQAAADEFRTALRLRPDSLVARDNLGVALAANAPEAILNWQSASDPATAHNNMAAILMERRQYPQARKELELALSYNRSHRAALSNLNLLSTLDGKPPTLAPAAAKTGWARFRNGWRRGPAGNEAQPRREPVQTASK